MKTFIKLSVLLICGIIFSKNTFATHMMGADVSYKLISAGKYKVTLQIYRDCTGVALGGVTATVSCGTNSNSLSTTKIGVRDITPVCSKVVTSCKSQSGGIGIGIEMHTFETILDLTKAPYSTWVTNGCKDFTVGWGQCCRNNEITTMPAASFYSECVINYGATKVNSSPKFIMDPVAFVCCLQPTRLAMGALDLDDKDSLSYKLVSPLSAKNTRIAHYSPFTKDWPMTSRCPPGSPKPCKAIPHAQPPLGFYFNEETGEMVFTPTKCDEVGVLCVEITEWRKDSLGKPFEVGRIRRDIQLVVVNCGLNDPPILNIAKKKVTIDANLCAPKNCITISASDAPPKSNPNGRKDSVTILVPFLPSGAKATYYNQNDTNPSVELCFDKVTNANFGHVFNIIIASKDDVCPMSASNQQVIQVTILPKDSVTHIRGYSYEDTSKNCKRENGELPTIQRKIAYGNKHLYVKTAEDGSYGLCVPTGKDTIKVMPHPFYTNDCPQVIKDFKLDSVYNIDFGTRGKKGIWGKVFNSTDRSCDTTDNLKPISQAQLIAMPGSYQSTTDDFGNYVLNVPAGTYKVFVKDGLKNYETCGRDTIVVKVNSSNDVIKDKNIYFKGPKLNYMISRGSSFMRKDRYNGVCLYVKDLNKTTIDSFIKVKVKLPLKTGDTIKPSSKYKIIGNTIEFDVKNLHSNPFARFCFSWKPGTNWKIGDTSTYTAEIDKKYWKTDIDTSNNRSVTKFTIRNSYDPNIKTTYQDSIITQVEKVIDYFVQFQNEGNDTAYYVEVRDTLQGHLDLNTFEMKGASHYYQYYLMNNVLHVFFPNINLSAKSKDEENSIGSFSYQIEQKEDITKEVDIPNSASIYFDLNPPVRTNIKTNTIKTPIEIVSMDDTFYCVNTTAKINYKTWFTPPSNNKFVIEMSDNTGNFDSYISLDTIAKDSVEGSLEFRIPEDTKSGIYRFRLKASSKDAFTYSNFYSDSVEIQEKIQESIILSKDTICNYEGITVNLSIGFDSIFVYNSTGLLGKGDKVLSFGPFQQNESFHATFRLDGCPYITDTALLTVHNDVPAVINIDTFFCSKNNSQSLSRELQSNESLLKETYWEVDYGKTVKNGLDQVLYYNYSTPKFYLPRLITESIHGCFDTSGFGKVQLVSNPDASFTTDADTVCIPFPFLITPKTTGVNHKWDFGDGNWGSNSSAFNYNFSKAGLYKITQTIEAGFGCTDTFEKEVLVSAKPVPNFTLQNQQQCITGNLYKASYTKKQDEVVTWDFGDGTTSNSNSVNHTYKDTGKYDFSLSIKVPGCKAIMVEQIEVFPQPKASFNLANNELCEESLVQLSHTSSQTKGSEVTWYLNDIEPCKGNDCSYTLTQLGANVIKLKLDNGFCSDSLSQSITVIESPQTALTGSEVCFGEESTLNPILLNLVGESLQYSLEFGDGQSTNFNDTNQVKHVFQAPGNFNSALISSYKGCNDTAYAISIINPKPKADFIWSDLPSHFLTLLIENTSLNSVNNTWTKEGITFRENNLIFNATFTNPGDYDLKLVTVSDKGCMDSIIKKVKVLGENLIFAPTAFTPNNDQLNDFWSPISQQEVSMTYQIFNRWGETVFIGTEVDSWDGTYEGKPAPTGTYIFTVESLDSKGNKIKQAGEFKLIR